MPGRNERGQSHALKPHLPRVRKPPLVRRPFRVGHLPQQLLLAQMRGATLPEKMVAGWLNAHATDLGLRWTYQDPLLGGQTHQPGSAIVDFALTAPRPLFLRVQGVRFHIPDIATVGRDTMQKISLEQIAPTIDLWEDDIYADVDNLMRDALAGVQRPVPTTLRTPHRPAGY